MVGGVRTMSGLERERAFLVRQTIEGRLSQREASERLGIGVRQLKRLVHAWRAEGDTGLVSRQRGRASHRRMADDLRTRISGLLREKYAGFGAPLAAEKLCVLDHIKVAAETVRRLQIDLGLWRPKKRPAKRVFQCSGAVRGSANWSRSTAVPTTGSKPRPALHADRVHR
jgi:transposase